MASRRFRRLERRLRRDRERQIRRRARAADRARRMVQRMQRSARARSVARRLRPPPQVIMDPVLRVAPRGRIRTPEGVTRGLARLTPERRARVTASLLAAGGVGE